MGNIGSSGDNQVDLSIVIPVYNEEESVCALHSAILSAVVPLSLRFEIIFVDDGSSDSTYDRLKQIKHSDPHIKVIRLRRNAGQTPAMRAGFDAARAPIIISMDGDLQNDPRDIPKLLAKIDEGYDLVCGWRVNRQDKLISRKIPSRIANRLIAQVTGVYIRDNGCSLKAYRAEMIKQLKLYSDMHRFIPAVSTLAGARIAEVAVSHHARQFGKSKYGISRTIKVIFDLMAIKMLIGFSSRPIVYFSLASLLVWALALLNIGIFSYEYLSKDVQSGFMIPAGVVLVLIGSACFTLLLGLIAESVASMGGFKQRDILLYRWEE